jgi:hypothetical protein
LQTVILAAYIFTLARLSARLRTLQIIALSLAAVWTLCILFFTSFKWGLNAVVEGVAGFVAPPIKQAPPVSQLPSIQFRIAILVVFIFAQARLQA